MSKLNIELDSSEGSYSNDALEEMADNVLLNIKKYIRAKNNGHVFKENAFPFGILGAEFRAFMLSMEMDFPNIRTELGLFLVCVFVYELKQELIKKELK